ncbi:MAG: motility associated factor glycosyltransferase family protein [Verrucomicrobia bacterium]|nr:motility associated factor glycosyltransferase family protein [Verrucomicrobiota bacterium]
MQVTTPVADVICLYGLPNHELYLELREWLDEKPDRFLVILEDDERVLIGHQSGHDRILLCYADSDEALKKIAWELVFLQFDFLKTPGNSSKNPEKMETIFAKMAFFQQGIHLVASDFQNRGLDLLENLVANNPRLEKAKKGEELFGSFEGVPAIICGAGVSLEKAAPYLKNNALLFAGGTALSSLGKLGISPHFGGLIDPHPPSSRYFQHKSFDVPLFFQTRVHPDLLKQMRGPLLWMPGSQNDLLTEEAFDGGWNVSTFLTAIALKLGCNPIILVGVDLAQRGEKSYAADLERPEGGELIWVRDDLYTRRDWLFAADWLSDLAKTHPEVEWINCSDGLEIGGFKKQNISELSFAPLAPFQDKIRALNSSAPKLDLKELRCSFERVGELCGEMLELLEKLFPNSPEKNGEYALLEMSIAKEIAYIKFLKPIWDIWKHVFSRQIPKDIPIEYGIGLNQWLFLQGICNDARKI